MVDVKKLLQAKKAEQVSKNLDAAKAEYETQVAELDRLQQQRQDQLLEASDAELDKLDQQINATQRQVDRLDAAIAKLAERLNEAQRQERRQDVERQLTDARKAVDEATNGLMDEYRRKAQELADVLDQMRRADKAAQDANKALDDARADGLVGDDVSKVATIKERMDPDHRTYSPPYREIRLPVPEHHVDMYAPTIWPR